MKTKFQFAALLTAALAAFATAGFSADPGKLNSFDEKFIKSAGADGKTEVKVAELAVKKASREDVKEFAQMMVADHTAVNSDLMALANKKAVDLSAVISPDGASEFQKLEDNANGKDFDNAFLKQMESDHKKCISDFQDAQKKAEDADLKAFIDKTLPGLQKHLDKVKQLRGEK
jgi:putative membrane protein